MESVTSQPPLHGLLKEILQRGEMKTVRKLRSIYTKEEHERKESKIKSFTFKILNLVVTIQNNTTMYLMITAYL